MTVTWVDGNSCFCLLPYIAITAWDLTSVTELPHAGVQVAQRIRGSVSSKQFGFEDLLCPLIAQACIDVCPKNPNNFNVDNVRVIKITGSGAYNSSVVKGIVIKRDTEGTVKGVTDAKVAVFAQGVDTSSTETKV